MSLDPVTGFVYNSGASPPNISWDAVEGAEEYEIQVKEINSPAEYETIYDGSNTTVDYTLSSGVGYYARGRTRNKKGGGPYTEPPEQLQG